MTEQDIIDWLADKWLNETDDGLSSDEAARQITHAVERIFYCATGYHLHTTVETRGGRDTSCKADTRIRPYGVYLFTTSIALMALVLTILLLGMLGPATPQPRRGPIGDAQTLVLP